MSYPLNIALIVFDGVQILDVTGPASVFAAANSAIGDTFYKVNILSAEGGLVQSSSAIVLPTYPLNSLAPQTVDTILIAGAELEFILPFTANTAIENWMLKASSLARRVGSVCTGAFALGHFGLINGKRVTTHWASCAELSLRYPEALVNPNAMYVVDENVWTSAGVTTGIDMCLEMVASDLGNNISNTIAKHLVMYARRPGYQSQFSPLLSAQAQAKAPFSELINWIGTHLTETLDVPRLASRCALSERSFYRKFTDSIGITPALFVENLRLDQARIYLSAGLSLKETAAKCGYSNAAHFSKAFARRFGMTPTLFRGMHAEPITSNKETP